MLAEAKKNLADLSDDEAFTELVNQDVRGNLAAESAALLRSPEHVVRWYDTLCTLKRTVEAQLAANRAEQARKQAEFLQQGAKGKIPWLQYRGEAERWRQGAIRFKNGVEDKLAEAGRIRRQVRGNSYLNILVQERDQAMKEVLRLRRAINEHKLAVEADTEDPEVVDDKLWSAVEQGTEFK